MSRRFRPPVSSSPRRGVTTWTLDVDEVERELVVRLLGELRELLSAAGDDPDAATSPVLRRLFPPAYPDDEEKEAEYQRLMRDELITSRLAQLDAVSARLSADGSAPMDEAEVTALMRSLNAVRIVLGTMLDVGEDDDVGAGEEGDDHEPERQLYAYLSWLLDWTVRAL